MTRPKSAAEHRAITVCMRLGQAVQKAATAGRQSEQLAEAAAAARAEAVKAIALAMPLLTAEQREQLRPILSGSIPVDQAGADTAAA